MLGPGFLDLPVRSGKPRRTGITHVLDRGIPLAQVSDLLEQNGCYVDVWKFGWGIAYLDPQLVAKLDLLARHRVLASPGGTLLEIAWAQGARARDVPAVAALRHLRDTGTGPGVRARSLTT
jgi:phosphosulfolactate synthase